MSSLHFCSILRNHFESELDSLSPKGTTGAVWLLMNEQVAKRIFDKKDILDQTDISTSHLDKIISELLAKRCQLLFEDVSSLLNFLSNRIVFIKLFCNELSRQTKNLAKTGTTDQQADFIIRSFQMIHTNMPIAYRDEKASAKLAKDYISLFKGAKKHEAEFHMAASYYSKRWNYFSLLLRLKTRKRS
jgi:hypothetical protein